MSDFSSPHAQLESHSKTFTVRVKICGITSVEDALLAAQAGADAIGLVFYQPSPRCVTLEQARAIALAVGPFVTVVGLFVDATTKTINSVLERVPLQLLQFHGDESSEFCQAFQRPYLKAIRMKDEMDLEKTISAYPNATSFLLDTYKPGLPGGTGEVFDWSRVSSVQDRPLILAGGLNPENVAQAILQTRVYGVDVSGGVEASPGKKDAVKVTRFIGNAKSAKP